MLNIFEIGSNIKIFTVDRLVYMSFYFYIGYLLKNYYEKISGSVKKFNVIYIVIIILFILYGNFYNEFILSKIIFPFLGIISFWYISLKIKKVENLIYNFLTFCGENSLSFYLLEVFCGTVYRVILIKIIPIEYNFLLVLSFFSLKLISLVIGIKYMVCKNKYFSFLLGAKYKK